MRKAAKSLCVAAALAVVAYTSGSPPAHAAEHQAVAIVAVAHVGNIPDKMPDGLIPEKFATGSPASECMVFDKEATYQTGQAATFDVDITAPAAQTAFKEDGKTRTAASIDSSPTGANAMTASALDASGPTEGSLLFVAEHAGAAIVAGQETVQSTI